MRRFNSLFWLLGAIVLFAGCATLQPRTAVTATETMLAAQTTIVSFAQIADASCTAGTLTQAQCNQAAAAYATAQRTYDTAANALALALATDEAGFWANYTQQHTAFLTLYGDIIRLAVEFNLLEGGALK